MKHKAIILKILFFTFFTILIVTLLNLQILKYKKYKMISERNYVRIQTIEATRGEIFDRNYKPIVTNVPTYDLYITPGKIINKEKLSDFLSSVLQMDKTVIEKIIFENRFRLYNQVLLKRNVRFGKLSQIYENLNYFPSLQIKTGFRRKYAYNNLFTGYIRKISKRELGKHKGYRLSSLIGKTGLEKYYENILKGKNGKKILQVDAKGHNFSFFSTNTTLPAENGKNLILCIDNDLQNFVRDIFPKDKNGAIIIMNAKTGGILAYVSYPDFDLNIFSGNLDSGYWKSLTDDERKPMLDRISKGLYPPGSVYKPVTASLGLKKKIIDAHTKLDPCRGKMKIGNRYFNCWLPSGHGALNVTKALKYSCDIFFYQLSLKYSLKEIEDFTKQNFLTVKTGVDIPGERKGFFPSKKWYVQHYGKYSGVIGQKVNLAIGQGEMLLTPIQLCAYYAAIANEGVWTQPHFLYKTISEKKDSLFIAKKYHLPISEDILKIIQNALYETVNEKYGTGTRARMDKITVYGKTGSAENHQDKDTHAWFCGYARFPDKTLAFTILLENGGHGGSKAAPLAKEFLSYILKKEYKNEFEQNKKL